MIRFGSGEDYVVEDVLMCLAKFSPPRPMKGYAVNVSASLRGGLSFMEGVDGGSGFNGGILLPLSRIYVSLGEY